MLLQQDESGWESAHKHSFPTSPTRAFQLVSELLTAIVTVTIYLMSSGLAGILCQANLQNMFGEVE